MLTCYVLVNIDPIFGVINTSHNLKGLQIGLINYIKKGTIPFLPVFNYGF